MRMNSKKGVSPLIATVLIIALTVALTVFLMNWAFGFFKERTEATSKTTEDQLLCATGVNFDFDCVCKRIGAAAPTCGVRFNYLSDLKLGYDILLKTSTHDGQAVLKTNTTITGITPAIADITAYESFSTADMALGLATTTKTPIDLEVSMPVIINREGRRIECGTTARLRKECSFSVE